MKTFTALLLFAALLFALPCFAQAPDQQWSDSFSSAVAGPSHANTSEGANPCVAFRVTYDAIGMSAISLQIEGAPWNNIGTGPGTFAAIGAPAIAQGTNPLTDPNNATLVVQGTVYYPFIRINVTTFTTTGVSGIIRVRTYGYKGTSASAGTGGTPCPPPSGGLTFNPSVTAIVLSNNEITSVSAGLFTGLTALQSLDLTINQLATLPSGLFTGLTALQTLMLDGNQLTALSSGIFTGLTGIQALSASGNQLTALPSGVFTGLTALQVLNFGGNLITALPSGVFTGLTALQILNFNSSQLTVLPSGVFTGLTALQNLLFSGNQLSTLATGIVGSNTGLVNVDFSSNALDANGVNNLLSSLVTAYGSRVDCAGGGVCSIDVSGGTNSSPTIGPPDGIAAAATLVADGWAVTTN